MRSLGSPLLANSSAGRRCCSKRSTESTRYVVVERSDSVTSTRSPVSTSRSRTSGPSPYWRESRCPARTADPVATPSGGGPNWYQPRMRGSGGSCICPSAATPTGRTTASMPTASTVIRTGGFCGRSSTAWRHGAQAAHSSCWTPGLLIHSGRRHLRRLRRAWPQLLPAERLGSELGPRPDDADDEPERGHHGDGNGGPHRLHHSPPTNSAANPCDDKSPATEDETQCRQHTKTDAPQGAAARLGGQADLPTGHAVRRGV